VVVRGRVLREATGEPVAGEGLEGSLAADTDHGPTGAICGGVSHIDWGETDKKGDL